MGGALLRLPLADNGVKDLLFAVVIGLFDGVARRGVRSLGPWDFLGPMALSRVLIEPSGSSEVPGLPRQQQIWPQ